MDEAPMPDRRGWWERHWKWVVPGGCLFVVLLGAAMFAGLATFVFGMMRGNDAYIEAMRAAHASPALAAAIGEPIEEGRFVSGEISETGASGKASLAIPLSGPRGQATVYVEATKSAGQWHYDVLVAQVEATGERIDLESADAAR
jgi:hypothetical protein